MSMQGVLTHLGSEWRARNSGSMPGITSAMTFCIEGAFCMSQREGGEDEIRVFCSGPEGPIREFRIADLRPCRYNLKRTMSRMRKMHCQLPEFWRASL